MQCDLLVILIRDLHTNEGRPYVCITNIRTSLIMSGIVVNSLVFWVNRYRVQGGIKDDWQTLRVVPEESLSITVYNLFSDALYQFMVLSRSRLGDEQFSKLVSSSTKRKQRCHSEVFDSKPECIHITYIHAFIQTYIQVIHPGLRFRELRYV